MTELYVVRGIFSPKLIFKPKIGRFSRDITITPSDEDLETNPEVLTALGGTATLEFNLGYKYSTSVSRLFISFTKSEENNAEDYNPINSILINIINGQKTINLPTFIMGLGGTSPVTTIDLRETIPVEDLVFSFEPPSEQFSSSDVSLTFNRDT